MKNFGMLRLCRSPHALDLYDSCRSLLCQITLSERCLSGASASTSSTVGVRGQPWSLLMHSYSLSTSGIELIQQGVSALPSSSTQSSRGIATAASAAATNPNQERSGAASSSGSAKDEEVPWPWIDPKRPRVLPVAIVRKPLEPVPLDEALRKLLDKQTPEQLRARMLATSVRFALDPRRSDHLVRGSVVLPYGTGRKTRLVVFAKGLDAEIARENGADVIGDEELITAIVATNGAAINFDKLIATPDFMRPLAKAGKVLGPKGLMPNPKLGTLTSDVATAIAEIRRGRLDYRIGRDACVRGSLGRVSMPREQLATHVGALVASLLENKPKALVGAAAAGGGGKAAAGGAGAAAAAAVEGGEAAKLTVEMLEGYVLRFLLTTNKAAALPISFDSLIEAANMYRQTSGPSAAATAAAASPGSAAAGRAAAAAAVDKAPKGTAAPKAPK